MTITIDTPPPSEKLITRDKFKTALGITGGTDDDFIDDVIDRTSQAIVDYCGRPFAQAVVTETLAGKTGIYLKLFHAPVTVLTSVTFDGTLVDADLYSDQEINKGFIFRKTGWQNTFHEFLYSVVYTYGFVLESFSLGTPTLPLSIEQACLQGVKSAYQGRDTDSNIGSESVPDVYSVKYGGGSSDGNSVGAPITDSMRTLLDPYRRFKL